MSKKKEGKEVVETLETPELQVVEIVTENASKGNDEAVIVNSILTDTPIPVVELVKKTPKEWALETGNSPKNISRNRWLTLNGKTEVIPTGMSRLMGSVEHEVASVLHGWREHEHHAGEPIKLTKEDYLAALAAAMPTEGNPIPHPAAVSPHKGGGVKVTFQG